METAQLHRLFLEKKKVSTDSRIIQDGDIYFALKGEHFNGNKFASQALEKGAPYAVIDEEEFFEEGRNFILVKDVLETLQELANFHRKYIKATIIGLTGSNGKTTTKELIFSVLSRQYKTIATKGNLNNHIGVPLTLLSLTEETEIGIIEMGANHIGEIAFLCEIAAPDYGYITNFGKAHLEGFGGVEGVIKGKSELYNYLRKNEKKAFINADDPKQVELTQGIERVSFGKESQNPDIVIAYAGASPNVAVHFKKTEVNSNLTGSYNFSNIAAAIAIGSYFNIPVETIKNGIESYVPLNNRSQVIAKNSNTILMDAYNANPSSMKAAIENFLQWEAAKKIVFLGDMFELGKEAEKEHQYIVDLVEKQSFDVAYLIGENFYRTTTSQPNILLIRRFEDLKEGMKPIEIKDSCILIKGSRGMALERVLELL